MGSTKEKEYIRSAEHFETLLEEQGSYFALAMLVDSGYDNNDLKAVLNNLNPIFKEEHALQAMADGGV